MNLASLLLLVGRWSGALSHTSSEQPATPDAELVRDAPLYPPLQSSQSYDPYDHYDTLVQSQAPPRTQPADKPVYEHSANNIESNNLVVIPDDSEADVGVETDDETNVQNDLDVADEHNDERIKRSSEFEWNKTKGGSGRVVTGDTILNIHGALRSSIGDGGAGVVGAAGAAGGDSRVDALVIRPAAASLRPPPADTLAHTAPDTTEQSADGSEDEARSLVVLAGSRVRLPCSLTGVSGVRWYRDQEMMPLEWGSHGGDVWREAADDADDEAEHVVIARASRALSGAWQCAGDDRSGHTVWGDLAHLHIYEAVRSVYLSVDGRRLDAGNTWLPARDHATLPVYCHADGGVPPPRLTWELRGAGVAGAATIDHRRYLRAHSANTTQPGVTSSLAVVLVSRELHNASLLCRATQPAHSDSHSDSHSRSNNDSDSSNVAKLEIRVTYPPSFVISRSPGFGVPLRAGRAAALSCRVDANPPAAPRWRRDPPQAEGAPEPPPPPPGPASDSSTTSTLYFNALSRSHAGWYRCRATWLQQDYSSIGYLLNVLPEDPPSPAEQNPAEPAREMSSAELSTPEVEREHVVVPLGGDVQLNCPKGSVGCWWRRDNDSWSPAGSRHAHGVLGISGAQYWDGGEYRCVGARGPRGPAAELKRVTLSVTGGVSARAVSAARSGPGWRLECEACGRHVRVSWLRADGGGGGGGGDGGGGEEERGAPRRLWRAALTPTLQQHCWRAVLTVMEHHEVWCVAVDGGGGGGGAVAVFPPRAPPAPPARARHVVQAGGGGRPAGGELLAAAAALSLVRNAL